MERRKSARENLSQARISRLESNFRDIRRYNVIPFHRYFSRPPSNAPLFLFTNHVAAVSACQKVDILAGESNRSGNFPSESTFSWIHWRVGWTRVKRRIDSYGNEQVEGERFDKQSIYPKLSTVLLLLRESRNTLMPHSTLSDSIAPIYYTLLYSYRPALF